MTTCFKKVDINSTIGLQWRHALEEASRKPVTSLLIYFDELTSFVMEDEANRSKHSKHVSQYSSITHTNRPILSKEERNILSLAAMLGQMNGVMPRWNRKINISTVRDQSYKTSEVSGQNKHMYSWNNNASTTIHHVFTNNNSGSLLIMVKKTKVEADATCHGLSQSSGIGHAPNQAPMIAPWAGRQIM